MTAAQAMPAARTVPARALGGDGYACRDREQLAQALADALKAERFSVIACEFSRSAYDGRI